MILPPDDIPLAGDIARSYSSVMFRLATNSFRRLVYSSGSPFTLANSGSGFAIGLANVEDVCGTKSKHTRLFVFGQLII